MNAYQTAMMKPPRFKIVRFVDTVFEKGENLKDSLDELLEGCDSETIAAILSGADSRDLIKAAFYMCADYEDQTISDETAEDTARLYEFVGRVVVQGYPKTSDAEGADND